MMGVNQLSRHEIYNRIESALAQLIVFHENEIISHGTGAVFTADGAILTAAHVAAGGLPIKRGEVDDPKRRILAVFSSNGPPRLYKPSLCPFEIVCDGLTPIQLDIAILVPVKRPLQPMKHLVASLVPPKLGDEVYFGGYSDEVEFPLNVDRHILPTVVGLDLLKREIASHLRERLTGPLIKRATVGNVRVAQWALKGTTKLEQSLFYLDNSAHDGVSGGPIVGVDGTLLGVVSKRMITKIEVELSQGQPVFAKAKVPAGSTLGVGLEPMRAVATQVVP
jgi:hypothetical protein